MTTATAPDLFRSINPADGTELARYEPTSWEEVDNVLDRAGTAFTAWARRPVRERAAAIRELAVVLQSRRDDLARLLTQEMGKPIREAEAEIDKCAWTAEWTAEHAAEMLAPQTLPTHAVSSEVRFAPLGIVVAIMPWNYPLWQVLRAAIPAIVAGNVVALKHAPNVSGSAYATAQLFVDAGSPDDLLQVVLTDDATTARMIADRRVAGVTLTGSVRAGQTVGEIAGRHVKKVVLELGGSDPFIVLGDANIAKAAAAACRGRMQNNGQSCVAAKRMIVVEAVADEFTDAFVREVAALKVGDPLDRDTDIGPLAREDIRDNLWHQMQASLQEGANLAIGGEPIDRPGWWFPPTVLTDVRPNMTISREETFGPLTGILVVPDEDAAIAAANHPDYGLGASIWTQNRYAASRLADRLEAGMVFVNAIVASDPRLPFGGIKQSGLGRELSVFGVREFVNVKTVCVGSPSGRPVRPLGRRDE
jgi:succinate-semialdehyde dehydrogenase / glutarate-semialdehyde dehydrogenase